MTIAKCPKCREQVSVPSGASRQAQVRCPMCAEEYLLGDALDGLPPLLVVIHDPSGQQVAATGEESLSFAAEEADTFPSVDVGKTDDEFRFAPSAVAAPAFQLESAPTPARPTSVTSRPRSKPKKGGGVRLVVQTVGGGVMGLIIAQLILWWMPGNWDVSNRDPFGLAAKVAPYAPFLLPASLRGGTATAQADAVPIEASPFSDFSNQSETKGGKKAQPIPSTPAESGGELNSQIPDFKFDANASDPRTPPVIGGEASPKKKTKSKQPGTKGGKNKLEPGESDIAEPAAPAATAPSAEPAAPPVVPDPFDSPDLTLDPSTKKSEKMEKSEDKKAGDTEKPASVEPAPPATTEPVAAKPAIQLADAPPLKPTDVTARLADAAAANEAWDKAENPPRELKRDMIIAIHDQLGRLGQAVAVASLAEPLNEEIRQSVGETLTAVARQPEKLTQVGIFAGIQLPKLQNQGAVFYGVVQSHHQSGQFHETQLKLNARNEPVVPVVSAEDFSEQLPAGTQVLVIGQLVASPATNLKGYEGDAPAALLHGMHTVVPSAP